MNKQEAMEYQESRNYNFDFHEDTQSFHCRICGQKVGWVHPNIPDLICLSSCCEGDESQGVCYDCWSKEHPYEDEGDEKDD